MYSVVGERRYPCSNRQSTLVRLCRDSSGNSPDKGRVNLSVPDFIQALWGWKGHISLLVALLFVEFVEVGRLKDGSKTSMIGRFRVWR